MEPAISSPRRRTGGRSARVVESVLAAAFDVLTEGGFDAFSIAAVAARAGVHETSIYRRWKTRGALAADACQRRVDADLALPDTGALAGDLKIALRRVIGLLESPGGRALLALNPSGDEGRALRESFWTARLAAAQALVERGKRRGELPETAASRVLIETLLGPIYFRVVLTGEGADDWPVEEVVDKVIAGFRAEAPRDFREEIGPLR